MKGLRAELKRLRYAVIFLIIIVAIGAAVIFSQRANTNAVPDLATATAEIRDVKKIVSVDGNIAGRSERTVYLPTNAEITKVNFSVGDSVTKNSEIMRAEVVEGFDTNVKKYKSPIKGTITAINYEVGDSVSPGLAAFTVVDQSQYRIEVSINENDIIDLETEQQATLILPAISLDDEYKGEVSNIDPAPISTTGAINYRTVIKPTTLPEQVKLGMSVSADILVAQEEDVLAIPESFLIEKEDKIFVKRLVWQNTEKTEYEITELEVEIGLRTDEFVEITSGLTAGDELVEPSFTENRGFGFLN